MRSKAGSIAGLAGIVLCLLGLIERGVLVAAHPVGLVVQAVAVALMIWARITFGRRSFHAVANPTEGGLVTSGPYAIVRHPIAVATRRRTSV
jgi:protein-S-isoprenylcysteine O-methyltransferase Ste14